MADKELIQCSDVANELNLGEENMYTFVNGSEHQMLKMVGGQP